MYVFFALFCIIRIVCIILNVFPFLIFVILVTCKINLDNKPIFEFHFQSVRIRAAKKVIVVITLFNANI